MDRIFPCIHKAYRKHESHNKLLEKTDIQSICTFKAVVLNKSSKFMLASQKMNWGYQKGIFKFVVYLGQSNLGKSQHSFIDLRRMLSLRGSMLPH